MSQDDVILKRYIDVAETVAKTFHPLAEVIVDDLRKPESSVIAIYNGHITNRKIGSPATDVGYKRLQGEIPDKIINYANESPSGKALKSSTLSIRNDKGKIIGAFSINFEVGTLTEFSDLISTFTSRQIYNFTPQKESFHFKTPKEEIRSIYNQYLTKNGLQGIQLSQKSKENIVHFFFENGHFNKRGIVTILSDLMGVTRATIYRYLATLTENE